MHRRVYNFYASPFRFVEILSKRIVRYARDYENATRLVGGQRAGCNFNEDELNGNRFNATHRVASRRVAAATFSDPRGIIQTRQSSFMRDRYATRVRLNNVPLLCA